MRQMKVIVTALAGLGVFVLAAVATRQGIADEEKVKAGESVVIFDDASHVEQGPVEFQHLTHKKAFGQEKLDCKQCHVKPKLFPMKRKPDEVRQVVTMEEMKQGKGCGACHNGKTTINGKITFDVTSEENCARCHKKK